MSDDDQPSREDIEEMLAAHAEWERARRWKDPVSEEGYEQDPKTFLRNLLLPSVWR